MSTRAPVEAGGAASPARPLDGASLLEPRPAPEPGVLLEGRVVDDGGNPIAGARVLVAPSASESMAREPCACPTCHKRLLECGCNAAAARVAQLVSRREGEWVPEATVRTGADGRFAWQPTTGGPFTVVATAEGHGPGMRPKMSPGSFVELTLGPARAVEGRVVDEQNHGLAGVAVTAVPVLLPRFVEAVSGPDGGFRVDDLADGELYLTASAPGLLPAGVPLLAASAAPVTLVLARPRTLEVAVRDGGRPAVGAAIEIHADHLAYAAVAGPGGLARVEALYPGPHAVSASLDARSASAEVRLEQAVTRIELALVDGVVARGRVTDEAGTGLPATVGASLGSRKLRDGTCDAQGRFRLDGLPEGARITASLEGYDPASARAEAGADVLIVLRARTLVRGTVLSAARAPLPGVQVAVRGFSRAVATSDANGAFDLSLAGPGPVSLLAHHSSFGAGELSVDAPADGVELVLSARGGLKARVVDADHRPVPGARASTFPEEEGPRNESFTTDVPSGPDGRLVLVGLPSATLRVRFSARGYQSTLRRGVEVPAAGLVDLGEVVLESGEEIAGVVLKPDGAPAAGAWVHARARGARASEGVAAGQDGAFSIVGLKAGSYQLLAFLDKSSAEVSAQTGRRDVVIRMPPPTRLRGRALDERQQPLARFYVDGDPIESADGRFDVPARAYHDSVFFRLAADDRITVFRQVPLVDGVADAGDVVLERTRAVEGQVVDERGQPIAGATVNAAERPDPVPRDDGPSPATTRGDGRFRLDGLSPGPVTIVARRGALVAEKAVLVPSDADLRDVRILIQSKGAIEGVVRGAGGVPLTAQIHTRSTSTTTDDAGRFRLDGLVPGRHLLAIVVESDAFRSLTRQVDVPAGETVRLDIDLGVGGTLRIQVVGATDGQIHLTRREDGVGPPGAGAMQLGLQIGEVRKGVALFTGLPPGRYAFAFYGVTDLAGQGEAEVRDGAVSDAVVTASRSNEPDDGEAEGMVIIGPEHP